ncbi:MAG: hypothetical protein IT361_13415 [Gemmatimonadaceae bacterium]|nr:hypothetical protein [Gemmatimonadaceae bacterium]
MIGLIAFAISAAAALIGYTQARAFVRDRLRYVDGAQSGFAPILAGAGALAVGGLAAALLPIIGGGTAIAFGVSVGLGVANGQRDIRRALPPGA